MKVDRKRVEIPREQDFRPSARFIVKNLDLVFQFVSPSSSNLNTYSDEMRIQLLVAASEFERACQIVLRCLGQPSGNIGSYRTLSETYDLPSYRFRFAGWHEEEHEFQPFREWGEEGRLTWWSAYNDIKHGVIDSHRLANLENLCTTVCAFIAMTIAVHGNTKNDMPSNLIQWTSGDRPLFSEWLDSNLYFTSNEM